MAVKINIPTGLKPVTANPKSGECYLVESNQLVMVTDMDTVIDLSTGYTIEIDECLDVLIPDNIVNIEITVTQKGA